jgi:hypothetical protein
MNAAGVCYDQATPIGREPDRRLTTTRYWIRVTGMADQHSGDIPLFGQARGAGIAEA